MSNVFSSPPGGEGSGRDDPVSWLQIESGWSVVGSDDEPVGSVVSIAGDKHEDIFDRLATLRRVSRRSALQLDARKALTARDSGVKAERVEVRRWRATVLASERVELARASSAGPC